MVDGRWSLVSGLDVPEVGSSMAGQNHSSASFCVRDGKGTSVAKSPEPRRRCAEFYMDLLNKCIKQ